MTACEGLSLGRVHTEIVQTQSRLGVCCVTQLNMIRKVQLVKPSVSNTAQDHLTLTSYLGGNCFFFGGDSLEVDNKNTVLTLQSRPLILCACMHVFGQFSALPDEQMLNKMHYDMI